MGKITFNSDDSVIKQRQIDIANMIDVLPITRKMLNHFGYVSVGKMLDGTIYWVDVPELDYIKNGDNVMHDGLICENPMTGSYRRDMVLNWMWHVNQQIEKIDKFVAASMQEWE